MIAAVGIIGIMISAVFIALAALAVVAVIICVVYILSVSTEEDAFDLPKKLTENEIRAMVRSLCAPDEKGRAEREFALSEKYCRKAYSILIAKSERGEPLEDYERIFADSRMSVLRAAKEVRSAMPLLRRLPPRKEGGILSFAAVVARSYGGITDKDVISSCVAELGAKRQLTWMEICALRPAFRLALLSEISVYASKIIFRDKMIRRAAADARKNRFDGSLAMYASYVNAYCRIRGDADIRGMRTGSAATDDMRMLAEYGAGMACIADSLRNDIFTDEFLISLSPAATEFIMRGSSFGKCTVGTQKALLELNGRAAASDGISEEMSAAKICDSAEDSGRDISEFLMPDTHSHVLSFAMLLSLALTAAVCAAAVFIAPLPYGAICAALCTPGAVHVFFGICVRIAARSKRDVPVLEVARDKYPKKQTALVACMALKCDDDIDAAYDKIMTVMYASMSDDMYYGILADCVSGYTPDEATKKINGLNLPAHTFFLLRRSAEDRKRGAIVAFNKAILSGNYSDYACAAGETAPFEYVITLDSDTSIINAERLVGIMEHPYNSRYAVMSLSPCCSFSGRKTLFSLIEGDNAGISHYGGGAGALAKISGIACYSGKGIYRVREFDQRTGSAFPAGKVLSHDFIEGALASCGDSGVVALEECPLTSASYYARAERWMRGDIQSLPYIPSSARDATGGRRGSKMPAAAKAIAADNAIRILVPPASLAALCVSVLSGEGYLLFFALLPYVVSFVLTLSSLFSSTGETVRGSLRILISVIYLPHMAFVCLTAAFTASVRMLRGKNLMAWTAFSPSGGRRPLFVANILFGVALTVSFAFTSSVAALVFGLLFLSALPLDLLLSAEIRPARLSEKEREAWTELAGRTWKYFTSALAASGTGLPPDNYDEDNGWAMRTSPTDIGMTLSAAVCAADIGIITEAERDKVVASVLDALAKLDKYDGCPYNWYDTDGKVLQPEYVSSADCGNLAAALIHVMSAGGENAETAERMLLGCDPSFLFSDDGLLHIGFRAADGACDKGKYDLLASESALAYLTAFACGKTGTEGFEKLSRICLRGGGRMLASWFGGVFEYMLPLLYIPAPYGSLMEKSARGVVKAHKKYAADCGCGIWGASESLYGEKYANGDSKYRAFGSPYAALSVSDGRKVFAPYATVMCAAVVRRSRKGIYKKLSAVMSDIGVYDSIDLTSKTIQRACMTHHQGMIMLALCELIVPGATGRRMRENAGIRAASLLLEEKADALRGAISRPEPIFRKDDRKTEKKALPRSRLPDINMLTDGEYHMLIDAYGRNASFCNGICVSRFDELRGLNVFVDSGNGETEITADAECVHAESFSRYARRSHGVYFETLAAVLPGQKAELRRIKCKNLCNSPKIMSVIVRVLPCLSPREADLSHKTFSRMFIETAYDEKADFAYAARTGGKETCALIAAGRAEYCGDERFAKTEKGVRFGKTTEGILSAKTYVVLPPYGEKTEEFIYAFGTLHETEALARAFRNTGFTDYCLASARTVCHAKYIPATYRDMASGLIFGGKENGAPKRLTLVATEANLSRSLAVMRYLKRSEGFGAEFSLTVLCRIPPSYVTGGRTALYDAARFPGGNCRVIDISSGMTREGAEALAEGTDTGALRNIPLPPFPVRTERHFPSPELKSIPLETAMGIGGYMSDCSYVTDAATPSPWYNVISDGKIGCMISDRGEFTFAANSREQKLTYHSCDELNDVPGDGVAFEERGCIWTMSRAAGNPGGEFRIRHSFGWTEQERAYNGITAVRKVYVSDGSKYSRVMLENHTDKRRTVYVMYFAELVLGDMRQRTAGGISCGRYGGGIYATDGKLTAYLASDLPSCAFSYSAESYRDGAGRLRTCRGLSGEGITPALAYSVKIVLPPRGSAEAIFTLSVIPAAPTAESAERAFSRTIGAYADMPNIESNEIPIKYYLKWTAYQTYAARLTARCGFQQPGGAIGFRDALQDSTALTGFAPSAVRSLLVECAAHQFEDGDVMHWWHEPSVGVRTRICDDRLFLPFAAAEYTEYTGDRSVWEVRAPFLENTAIPSGQPSVYGYMSPGKTSGTLREHCLRAIRSLRISPRGLVLMGGGDWNDGMDRLGAGGKGESVWCSMFAYYVAGRFLPYAEASDRSYLAELRRTLRLAVASCKRGDAYIRAFGDDGMPLGADESDECKADLLVAAWAVLSGIESGVSAGKILSAAYGRLYDGEHKLLKLLDPPLTDGRVGYIADYPPGVRENGGQYTHAAVWFLRALFESDMDELACGLLRDLLPYSHTSDIEGVEKYMKEPYVMAGDVYSGALAGRGGWTWYTGSAGWMYRTLTEQYYGITVKNGRIALRPHMTCGSADLRVKLKDCSFSLGITAHGAGARHISIDGIEYSSEIFSPKMLDGKQVVITRDA